LSDLSEWEQNDFHMFDHTPEHRELKQKSIDNFLGVDYNTTSEIKKGLQKLNILNEKGEPTFRATKEETEKAEELYEVKEFKTKKPSPFFNWYPVRKLRRFGRFIKRELTEVYEILKNDP